MLTPIEWCFTPDAQGRLVQGYSFNGWWGCTHHGKGCAACYAQAWAKRMGLELWGPKAPRRFFADAYWAQPAKWNARAKAAGVQPSVFGFDMADVFEQLPNTYGERMNVERRRYFVDVVEQTQHLRHLILTKRIEDALELVPAHWRGGFPDNVVIMATVACREDLPKLDILRTLPAKLRGVSFEPLIEDLGPVDLTGIHWAIPGLESQGREGQLGAIRSIVAECRRQHVAVFVKQLGTRPTDGLVQLRYESHKAADPMEWPEDLRVREFPWGSPVPLSEWTRILAEAKAKKDASKARKAKAVRDAA